MYKIKIKCIYAIKDKRNDKVIYIGQTGNFKKRQSEHFSDKRRRVTKYMFDEGRDNFEMFVLEELSDDTSIEEMRNKEQNFIDKFNTHNDGFNIIKSGNISLNKSVYRKIIRETDKSKEWYKNYTQTEKFKSYQVEYHRQYRLKKKQESQDK